MPKGGYRVGAGRKPITTKVKSWPAVVIHLDPAWLALMPSPRTKYIREAVEARLKGDGLLEVVDLFGGGDE